MSKARRCLPEAGEEHQQPDEQLRSDDATLSCTRRVGLFPVHTPYYWLLQGGQLEWFPKREKISVTEL